jgi:hypothetical protein
MRHQFPGPAPLAVSSSPFRLALDVGSLPAQFAFPQNPEISTDLSRPRGKIQSNNPTFHATYIFIPSKYFGGLIRST